MIHLVLLLCDRLTRLRWASANLLLSCSVFSCSIRSLISASSHIPTERKRKILLQDIQNVHYTYLISFLYGKLLASIYQTEESR